MTKVIKKYRFYRFYEDTGHGWVAVKRKEVIELGILEKITGLSHQKGDTIYLEEDFDLTTFINALKVKDITYSFKNSYKSRSPIRSYDHFTK